MRFLRKYCFIGLLAARSNLAYLAEVYGRVLFMAVILYIFLRLWQATYSACGVDKLADLTLQQMLWYLTITEAIMLSGPGVTTQIDEDVRTGAITGKLVRPLCYPLATMAAYLGERTVRFALNLVAGSAVTYLLVGVPQVNLFSIISLVLTLPLAFVIDFLGCFVIGLGAFWLEDTSGLFLIYSRLNMMLGGMLLPLELFPDWLRQVVRILPFPNVVHGPARLFLKPEWQTMGELITRQFCCVLGLSLVVALLWRTALKRVFSNGG